MEISKKVILQTLVPRIPGIIRTVILNKLHLSPCADKQDALVEVVVYVVRAFMALRRPIGLVQQRSVRDPGVKGAIWVSKVTALAGDAHTRDAVVRGIQFLSSGTASNGKKEDDGFVFPSYTLPDVHDVGGEWNGFRSQADSKSPRPDGSEHEQYRHMMDDVTSDVTILYFHGGAYVVMDPATHREVTSKLAKQTGGRCFSVRYRLAPQNPFPAALVDALTAYLYLLAPPEDSFHQPVPAKNIVFAGDSAGGNLACVLGLLLVTLRRHGVTSVPFHGKDVPLEMPAGLTLNSPWCDIGRSLPSLWSNAKYDYLEPPGALGVVDKPPPSDEIWPSSPPRAEMYCQASLLMHPLVSPVVANPEMWQGCPPVFICGGNEALEDEFTVMARNIYLSGSAVDFVGYEGMPHCFAMVVKDTAVAKDCMEKWAQFCVDAVGGAIRRKDTASWMKAKTSPFQFYDVKLAQMGLTDQVVREKMKAINAHAHEREERDLRQWRAAGEKTTNM